MIDGGLVLMTIVSLWGTTLLLSKRCKRQKASSTKSFWILFLKKRMLKKR
ncbi:MAG TPA: hypothetical protein ENK90_02175 [Epsilonproteobacteria bacterium]|nr:hypothetical protein [Campylobacterota bacterium]